ncbi:hypothetical protein [Psychromonas aquimarina]|uniref:hypothetical protein n=1 Tax=Psychromonas aquimarina TaxID=444919 RepID=UPI0003FD918C|nr:hypothetical protein [Psychromonas aquimarina]
MNKVFLLCVLWASHTFSESFEISDVDVVTYQVFNGSDSLAAQTSEKSLCMSVMCNQKKSIDSASKAEVSAVTQNTTFETLGEAIFILGQMGLADNCRDKFLMSRNEASACEW